jgi:hypothetical protein
MPRPSNSVSFNQPQVLQRDNRIDPSLTFLSVPPGSRARSSLGNADPITRFYNEDPPWSSERMRTNVSFNQVSFAQPNSTYGTFRTGPGSEIESLAPRSDSGYHTLRPHSLVSNEPSRGDQDLPSDMTLQVANMDVSSASSEPAGVLRVSSSVTDQASVHSGRSTARSTGQEIRCPDCKEVSKCRSDHKCVPDVIHTR